MPGINLLKNLEVKNAKTTKKVNYMPDGKGLYLRVRNNGQKYWIVKLYRGSAIHERGIGSYPEISLENARDERDRYKRLWKEGKDPSIERLKQKYDSVSNLEQTTRPGT
jgi:hypothetical protein